MYNVHVFHEQSTYFNLRNTLINWNIGLCCNQNITLVFEIPVKTEDWELIQAFLIFIFMMFEVACKKELCVIVGPILILDWSSITPSCLRVQVIMDHPQIDRSGPPRNVDQL